MLTPPPHVSPLPALHLFAGWLQSRMHSGQERIWLSSEGRVALKEICRMKPGRMDFSSWNAPVIAMPDREEAAAILERKTDSIPAVATRAVPDPLPAVAPAALVSASTDRYHSLEECTVRLAAVRVRADAAIDAHALVTLRDTLVFSQGNPTARLMLVGEAPSADDEKLGSPFGGRVGMLLDKILHAMKMERSEIYLTNVCKFRPKIDAADRRAMDRNPTMAEMLACRPFLVEEIKIVRPEVIVALGPTAAEGLRGVTTDFEREVGRWLTHEDTPLIITAHPAHLLWFEDYEPENANAEKRKVWEALLMVMVKLGLPVTERQSRYFAATK